MSDSESDDLHFTEYLTIPAVQPPGIPYFTISIS